MGKRKGESLKETIWGTLKLGKDFNKARGRELPRRRKLR